MYSSLFFCYALCFIVEKEEGLDRKMVSWKNLDSVTRATRSGHHEAMPCVERAASAKDVSTETEKKNR